MNKIRARNLYKIFGEDPDHAKELLEQGKSKDEILEETGHVIAVLDASFDVDEGEIFVVMGLSGSGKSTLVRMINRLIDPTSGTIEVNGEDITHADDKRLRRLRVENTSMVFQRFALFPHRTVLDNTAFGLEVKKIDHEERVKQAQEALEMVGLAGWGDSYPDQLSGGMQQRVGLARALATNTDIMLMDEPFSALDPLIRREMQHQLLELQERLQKTIVFITHDLNEAMMLGDKIAVMRAGAIVQSGTAEQILNEPATDYVAAFTQDVDRTRVISASAIMRDPLDTVSPKDGPHVAMHKLRDLQVAELYVVDPRTRKLIGVVHDTDLASAHQRGEQTLDGLIKTDVPKTTPDTTIGELYGLAAEYDIPIAVVDEDDRLVGVIPRVSLLEAVSTAPSEVVEADDGETAQEPEAGSTAETSEEVVRQHGS